MEGLISASCRRWYRARFLFNSFWLGRMSALLLLALPTQQCWTDKPLIKVMLLQCSAAKLVELMKQKINTKA